MARMGDIIEEVYLNHFTVCRMRLVNVGVDAASDFAQLDRGDGSGFSYG